MSKFGDVVGKLEGGALEAASALTRQRAALRLSICSLSMEVFENGERMWAAIEEHVALDREARSYSFKPETGEVIDVGPLCAHE